ncbi:MAG: ferritin [bacterium]
MLSKKFEEKLNDQMNFEIYSAFIYKAMAAYCETEDLPGFAQWLKAQTKEEFFHGEKMYDYLIDRGARPYFKTIDAPQKEWDSVKAVFEDALAHEKKVTARINELMDISIEEHDHASRSFLNWYVDEQVEEEASVDDIIKKIDMLEGSGNGLYMLDKELGGRKFSEASDGE